MTLPSPVNPPVQAAPAPLPQSTVDDIMGALDTSTPNAVLLQVAARETNRAEDWDTLFTLRRKAVTRALAANPATPTPILTALWGTSSGSIKNALVANPSIGKDQARAHLDTILPTLALPELSESAFTKAMNVLAAYVNRNDVTDKERENLLDIALDDQPDLQPDWLGPWTRRPDSAMGILLEYRPLNPHLFDRLTRLTIDRALHHSPGADFLTVVLLAAINSTTAHPATLTHIVHLNTLVTKNATASSKLRWRLMTCASHSLQHPNCPTPIVEQFCSDPNPLLRNAAAANPRCPDAARVFAALLN